MSLHAALFRPAREVLTHVQGEAGRVVYVRPDGGEVPYDGARVGAIAQREQLSDRFGSATALELVETLTLTLSTKADPREIVESGTCHVDGEPWAIERITSATHQQITLELRRELRKRNHEARRR